MTCKLCNDTGEQRYWEGRWRDEKAENERLMAVLRWYADYENWLEDAPGWSDEGGLARAALSDDDHRAPGKTEG